MGKTQVEENVVEGDATLEASKGPAKSKGIRKKDSKPRPPARPYKKMADEQLNYNITQVTDKVEMTESRLKAYSVRLNKLNRERQYRDEEAV